MSVDKIKLIMDLQKKLEAVTTYPVFSLRAKETKDYIVYDLVFNYSAQLSTSETFTDCQISALVITDDEFRQGGLLENLKEAAKIESLRGTKLAGSNTPLFLESTSLTKDVENEKIITRLQFSFNNF